MSAIEELRAIAARHQAGASDVDAAMWSACVALSGGPSPEAQLALSRVSGQTPGDGAVINALRLYAGGYADAKATVEAVRAATGTSFGECGAASLNALLGGLTTAAPARYTATLPVEEDKW
jgi:hypothetical protein